MSTPDELTVAVLEAVQLMTVSQKANTLLETALKLIESGKYGSQVEKYLEVYLQTPNLPNDDVSRALRTRANARKLRGEQLLLKAQQDYQALLAIDPHCGFTVPFRYPALPASQRTPPELWERVARFIPRYHLRTWLFISPFHRDIAVRIIFHTVDLYFGEDSSDNLNRGLDIFERAKVDPVFASRVKVLRLHWAYEEGDMLDTMLRFFRASLPDFKSLQDFEWIGYPEMRADVVQTVLKTHSKLSGLGLIGWHFDAIGISSFTNLQKFTLRAEDDDGFADINEVRSVLDANHDTLTHLVLGAYLARTHSWDHVFESPTVRNLRRLDLVDTRISHLVLSRIMQAGVRLEELMLHGTFEDPDKAAIIFSSDDRDVNGTHIFLPHLTAFRFVVIGHDTDLTLYESVAHFLRGRTRLERLDLGNCPWEIVRGLLPVLTGLRALGVRMNSISRIEGPEIQELVRSVPQPMRALRVNVVVSEREMHHFAPLFKRLSSLTFLHLQCSSTRRPKEGRGWLEGARSVAAALENLDFVGWHGEHYVVVRRSGLHQVKREPHFGKLARKPPANANIGVCEGLDDDDDEQNEGFELKELPARRRLDCGKGVDLGTDEAIWLERKDVPVDYEVSELQ